MTQIQWRGVFPALTTKFTAADEIDWDAMAAHLDFQLDAGVHGLIMLGTIGVDSAVRLRARVRVGGSTTTLIATTGNLSTGQWHHAALTHDGKRIAYTSNDSGIFEIYVEPFPELGRRFKLTTGGATGPVWAPDGSRLYYRRTDTVDFDLVAVDVVAGDEFDIGDREDLFPTARYGFMDAMTNYDIDPDGERFVFISAGGNPDLGEGQSHVVVVGALNQAREGRD